MSEKSNRLCEFVRVDMDDHNHEQCREAAKWLHASGFYCCDEHVPTFSTKKALAEPGSPSAEH